MPTLSIGDKKVKVGDEFLKLSPDEQNAAVEEIAQSLGAAQPAPEQPLPPPVEKPPAVAPQPEKSTLQSVREAIHSPTRILENGIFMGLGDRIRAGMDAVIGNGSYGDNLKREQAETDKYKEEHPIASTAANVVGGVAVPLGAIGAASKAATLGGKTAFGALGGGLTGALQGGFESKDWTDLPQTAKDVGIGGIVGGGIGMALPGLGRAIGAGYRKAADMLGGRISGMSRGGSRHLNDALDADTVPAVRAELDRLGPDAMLADAGPAFLGKAQGASLNSDEGRSVLFNALKKRDQGTNTRIQEDVNRALGPAEDPVTAQRNITNYRSEVDSKNYPQVLKGAPPVDTVPILSDLDDAIAGSVGNEQKALKSLQSMMYRQRTQPKLDAQGRPELDLDGRPVMESVPVPQNRADVLHKIKQELDNVIEYDAPGLGLASGALQNQQASLKQFRHRINEALEQQVDGYARSNRVSARLARRADAVDDGTKYLGEGKTTPSPERFNDDWEQRELGERVAFAKGSRGEIERKIGTKANDLQALRGELQGEGGWNTAKIATVHGDDAADELTRSVDRNLKFRDTHNKVAENSQTEIRRAAREGMKATEYAPSDLFQPNSTLPGIATTILKRISVGGLNRMTEASKESARREVANALTLQGDARDRLLEAMIEASQRRQANDNVSGLIGDRAALAAALAANVGVRERRTQMQR